MSTPSERLKALGLDLPEPRSPVASYVAVVRTGDLLFVSGQLSIGPDGLVTGKLGADMDVTQGKAAAAHAALLVLAQVVHAGGVPLERIARVVKLSVLVNSTADFTEHHIVANGASDLIGAILGDKGAHTRAAFGVAALPLGAAVEIEAVVEVAT